MPAVVVPVATWIAGTVSVAGAAVGITGAAGAWLTVAAYTVSEIALYAGMSYAVDAATRPKIKPAGSEITFNMDPAYPREMIIGQRLVGGSMVARYSRGSNLYNAHMVIQVADHPCVELSKVYDGGRVVQATPLTHGSRTEITAYSASGGARVWMTWHDGRPGQTADSDLVTKSAQDPEVVSGKIPGWSNDHVGAGCAYIHVEVQWDSDILTSIPQFTFLVKGAKLYDRRLDTTAGGSGSHRLDDPSTWEYSTNAAVAADHFLLGYKVEDDDLAFGIGLHPSEVPYEIFANQADLADEDVETGTGGDVETIKRYAVNGVVSTADYFEEVLEAFQVQMAARFVDLGGRIGILGAEERDISLDLSDMDLVSDEQMQFADKLPFSDLYGSVGGTYADPANLYQQTPYDTLTTAYNALPDGGEAQQAQLPLPYEIHPRRAVRLASAWINRESLQPRLVGVFMAVAWALEPGDWFTFSSERLALTEAKFEVIDIAKRDDFTVTITARAIDPDFLAFSVDDDPEIGTPPEIDPFELLLDSPEFDVEVTTLEAGGVIEPAIEFTLTSDETVAREIVIEYGVADPAWDEIDQDEAVLGPTLVDSIHASQIVTKIRKGILPETDYLFRAKSKAGIRESAWTDWSTLVTTGATYAVGSASSVPWSGVTDSGGKPDDNADVTASNTAAAITGQGAFATLSSAAYGGPYLTGFAALAAKATIDNSALVGAGVIVYTALSSTAVRLGTNITRNDGSTSLTDALAVTSLGTAAAIVSQGSLATISRANVVALAGTEALNNALVPVGANMLVDTDFRWQSTYWTRASESGSSAFSVSTSTLGLRKSVLTGSGMTVGHYIRKYAYNQRSYLSCKPGDVVGFRVLAGGDNLSSMYVRVAFRDAAGAFVGSAQSSTISSGILAGTGEETTFNEMTVYGTAPSGTVAADCDVFGYASTSAPVLRVAKPMLAIMASGQTVVPAFAPGREHEIGANVTETRTAAAITGQGGLATLGFVTFGTNVRRSDGSTSATDSDYRTSLGVAASITSQGGLATLSFVTISTNLRLADGTTVATTAMVVTASGTAAAIASQGALATLNAVATAQISANAVTQGVADETDASVSIGSSWVEIADVSVTTPDANSLVFLAYSLMIYGDPDGSIMEAQIKRDATVIYGPTTIGANPPFFSETFNDEGLIEYQPTFNGQVSGIDTDAPGAAGTYVYKLEVRVASASTTSWAVEYRRLFALLFKR
jgi:hypothetical protein